jgi:polar amino acid transport system substrate-binding protein
MKTVAAAAAILTIIFSVSSNAAEKINFVTESYPPLNFREGTVYKGVSVEQLNLIMKNTGVEYSMQMMPWARALSLATTQPGYCVFTTVHNKERDPLFKWVEPLLKSRTVLIRKAGSAVAPKTLDEAKAYIVGTERDDFTQTILENNHFPRIDLATDLELTLKKLMSGRIDLMPVSEKYYESLLSEGKPVEKTVVLAEDVYSIACNKSVPDSTISLLQKKLNELIADGTQEKLFKKYGLSTKQ